MSDGDGKPGARQCAFPGCMQPAAAASGGGRPPAYCEQEVLGVKHNSANAATARRRLRESEPAEDLVAPTDAGQDPVANIINPEPDADEFCPTPDMCFPAGLADNIVWAMCSHGSRAFGE